MTETMNSRKKRLSNFVLDSMGKLHDTPSQSREEENMDEQELN